MNTTMKLFPERATRFLLIIPVVILFAWLRYHEYFHAHLGLFGAFAFLFFATLWLLIAGLPPSGRSRVVLCVLWLGISGLVVSDLVQILDYGRYSERRFSAQARTTAGEVKRRAEELVDRSRSHSRLLEDQLRGLPRLAPDVVPAKLLSSPLGDSAFDWGVYNSQRRLIAWKGPLNAEESFLAPGQEDSSVVNLLHQQFLKYKHAVAIGKEQFFLVVLEPFAADYGLQTRYLRSYNLLTNGLPIRPVLLYNAQTGTSSPDLTILNVGITRDFSIAMVYDKRQYTQLLESRRNTLHGWLEFVSLAFLLYAAVFSFFQFAGLFDRETPPRRLLAAWAGFLLLCAGAAFAISQFSVFAGGSLFSPKSFTLAGYQGLLRTPGSLAFTAFFLFTVLCALMLLLRRVSPLVRPQTGWRYRLPLILGGALLSAVFLGGYYSFQHDLLTECSFNLVSFPLFHATLPKIAVIFGLLWLDVSVVMILALILAACLHGFPRSPGKLAATVALVVAAALTVLMAVFPPGPSMPYMSAVLLAALTLLIFYLDPVWNSFEKLNLLSRFFVILIVFSVISFFFHFSRVYYARRVQKSFIENVAAKQVRDREEVLGTIMDASEKQLDAATRNLSMDPLIPDLAYRLWTATDLARSGYVSAVEIYDSDGVLLNRFSLRLTRLTFDFMDIATGQEWVTVHQRTVAVGNISKPVLSGARMLPSGRYLVVQAVEDYENLPFVPSASPFREVFRPERATRRYAEYMSLNVYDEGWQPVFVSRSDLTPAIQEARDLLKQRQGYWKREELSGRTYNIYYFRLESGYATLLVPAFTIKSHLAEFIDSLMFNFLWLAAFGLVMALFFRRYLALHFRTETPIGFNFFQKLLLAFLVFSMIPMLSLSFLIRSYVVQKKTTQVISEAVNSFSVASRFVGDYMIYQLEKQATARELIFNDPIMEYVSQVIQRDISLYFDRYLLATGNREFYSAGLLGEQIPGQTHVDLFLMGRRYSITPVRLGSLEYLNISGRIYHARFKDEVISIPFLIDTASVDEEVLQLRQYLMIVGASLILFAVFLGYFLASRFARPVNVLIEGTAEMSRGNLGYRIREVYQDEFHQLVDSFNSMANSLDEQQQALERRRAYTQNLLNNITTAVISTDRTMNVIVVNPAAVEMFGVPADYRGPLEDCIPAGGEWDALRDAVRGFESEPRRFQFKEVTVFRTEREATYRLVFVPLFQEQEWNGAILLVEDVSDIIRSNRLAAWAEMARQVAHEVKNPLTPIQLAVEHLMRVHGDRSENFDAVLHNCADVVLRQVKTLRKLVADFSQYGRPQPSRRRSVELAPFLRQLAAGYGSHMPAGIRMETKLAADLGQVMIDEEKIRAVLMNLIENGLQAMDGAGTITLRAARAEGSPDTTIRIQVSDTGRGVPPDVLPRMFEPYFSTKTGGTGLGLAIARNYVEDHGGRIEVESRQNEGTTFTIHLPAA